jgi:thioredoxin-related protein
MVKASFIALASIMLWTGRPAPEAYGRPAPAARVSVQWLSLQEAQTRSKDEPKVILLDLYTDWCYWCKVMEKNTYEDPRVAGYVEKNFYPVRFNAETRSSITWKGQSFAYNPNYKVNELAVSLTHGNLAFPTTVIITPDDRSPQYLSGYLKPADLEPVLRYFGDGAYKTMSYRDFRASFHPSW